MALYYNRHHGSLAVATRGGKPAVFPGKSWTPVSEEDEGSEELIDAVRKGFLARFVAPVEPVAASVESKPIESDLKLDSESSRSASKSETSFEPQRRKKG